ncbi:acyl-CoA N-acyltransferase [Karstenula rhodostoma CBS 690.94]|uniref:Acyl-CoA N-acyltransferase n=1 Tax=Karstenula rhodostoma CBS 690.94 TaxID=1392251 RepID=A0A9P4UEJ0_9PLEO|nr:acyl-CoA N-acyltransferase [Karstenula rhodostoma CBS 690.94]
MHSSSSACSSPPSSTPQDQRWTVEVISPTTVNEVVTFINNARHDMFPTLHTQLSDDVARWVQSGTFLAARDATSKSLVATIGFVAYDHRFPSLHYRDNHTVEVVRLYVLPRYRRAGLGATLFEELKGRAEEQGVRRLYLHTHPFLPGAVGFWEKRGFGVVGVERDEVWKTTHMEMLVGSGEC